ncbi:hypothetical protein HF1_04690 [Mycoplasma haemofelis str. Langford 1]|uniref:Uncharacterized protein n=1 Tax=Mycoplasma haemofelis (strain Langford 1) TaxID=941640 RepID=E8ZH56_MYCHL|nr:hypothetical protein [Mycoplasma haemofelis]CBY92477.1 hypothetical protein HF1_04690 [Mycoplasma haemofelis str. Langford 1]
MAISSLYKGAALLGGAGSVAGGYALATHLSSDKKQENKVTSIEDRLRSEGYTPLDFTNTNGDGWSKIKEAYKLENSEDKRFSGVEKEGNNTLSGIRDSCLRYLKEESTNESNYKMSRRWCVVPISVKDKLGAGNLLKSGTNESDDHSKWDEVVKKNDKDNNKFVTFSESGKSSDDKKTEIKKQCETKAAIETTKEEFEESLNQVNLWCTQAAGTAG